VPRYVLSWVHPNEHLFDVAVTFIAPVDDPVAHLPSWRPGRYLIQNYAANVREWSPNMTKIAKSSWRVAARAGEEVTISYRFFAGVLDAGSSFLDEEEAYFNGSNLFVWIDGLRGDEASLTIAAPADWNIETQLARGEGNTFRARDYDHLIDSPTICAATMTRHSFVERGARIHLIFRNDEGIDTEQFVEPVRAIVRAHAQLFGGLPLDEYRFLYHVGDRWHGVEHEDSTSIIVRRSALVGAHEGDDGFDHVLSITAHEFFHLWNVKRILPAVFAPYDYTTETPTRLLWAMEGITSYYGDLLLVRAGLWSPQKYLEHLQKEIETLENAPGRELLSLAQASFDAWLQEPAQMHDKSNAWISFYSKGEVVAALLDILLRTRSEHSLDDVMRHLWREYGQSGRGLEQDAIERAVMRVTGVDVRDFFARSVYGVEPLPYAELFAAAGVDIGFTARDASLGATLRRTEGRLVVESVVRGGAAMDAGLLPGDELLAIDRNRMLQTGDVEPVLRDGDAVELLVARAGVVRTRTLVPRRDGSVDVTLTIAGESALRDAWLRRDDE
jgi:predicted metalloprotease with PDZ domain